MFRNSVTVSCVTVEAVHNTFCVLECPSCGMTRLETVFVGRNNTSPRS
jgi:predicted RNA-binding Zn-ribbon protein involved in translation (DUF1610 family)